MSKLKRVTCCLTAILCVNRDEIESFCVKNGGYCDGTWISYTMCVLNYLYKYRNMITKSYESIFHSNSSMYNDSYKAYNL